MAGDTRGFWQQVDVIEQQLIDTHRARVALFKETGDNDAFEGQPGDGSGLFIISIENLDKMTDAGAIVCMGTETPSNHPEARKRRDVKFHLAATRIRQGTHRIATHDEIREFQKRTRDSYMKMVAEEDRKAGKSPTINVNVGGKKQQTEQTTV